MKQVMSMTRAFNGTGHGISRLYAGLALEMDVEWHAPLPAGAKILAANHPTTTDPFLMMGLTNEPVYILITNMCFQMPLLGGFLRRGGHIPVVAGNGRPAFDRAVELLRAGRTVGIFPEGALSPLAGGACPAHTGVARLALAADAPVIPVGIALERDHIKFMEARGGNDVETARWYLGGAYAVTGGLPLRLAGDPEDRGEVRSATEQIMGRIMSLASESGLRLRSKAATRTLVGAPSRAPAFGRP